MYSTNLIQSGQPTRAVLEFPSPCYIYYVPSLDCFYTAVVGGVLTWPPLLPVLSKGMAMLRTFYHFTEF